MGHLPALANCCVIAQPKPRRGPHKAHLIMADQQFHASPGTTTATEVTPATDDMKHGRYDIAEEPNKGVKDLANLDEASRFLHEHHVSDARMTELSQDTTALRKLRRRTDLLLLPLLCGTVSPDRIRN